MSEFELDEKIYIKKTLEKWLDYRVINKPLSAYVEVSKINSVATSTMWLTTMKQKR